MWCSSGPDAAEQAGYDAEQRSAAYAIHVAMYESTDVETRVLQAPGQPLLYAIPNAESNRQCNSSASDLEADRKPRIDISQQQGYVLLQTGQSPPSTGPHQEPLWPAAAEHGLRYQSLEIAEHQSASPDEQPVRIAWHVKALEQGSLAEPGQDSIAGSAVFLPPATPTFAQPPAPEQDSAEDAMGLYQPQAAYQHKPKYNMLGTPVVPRQSPRVHADGSQGQPGSSSDVNSGTASMPVLA